MKRFALPLALAALLAGPGHAAPTVTTVGASALNKFFDAVPAPSGSLGWHQVTAPRPCVPDFWNVCTIVLFSGEVGWSMSAPTFSVTSTGVKLSSRVTATFAGHTTSADVTAKVSVAISGTNLYVFLSSISVPVTFDLPGRGLWSPGSVTIPLGNVYGVTVPFLHTRIEVPAQGGGLRAIAVNTTKVNVSYQTGAVVLSSEHLPW